MSLQTKLREYVAAFNARDEECYRQKIPNDQAVDFLSQQIPLLECPDPDIERTYYFRWWTYRKHIKETEKGHIITEFLPPVRWAGPYNSIVCPACFHIREGRWLRDPDGILKEYICFWLDGHGQRQSYSTWLVWAVWEYCRHKDDFSFALERLPQLVEFFEEREAVQRRSCGLYWSKDGRDGMEYSISGSGLRPTLNSYVWADATAIARLAAMKGDRELQQRFQAKADQIRFQMDKLLWDKDFYKVLPLAEDADPQLTERPSVPPEHDVREQLGFIPWYFGIPGPDKTIAFDELNTNRGFRLIHGLTSAEARHPRFMEKFKHECLWNGPVWPFATSQTLVALANLLRSGQEQDIIDAWSYYDILQQYAENHRLALEDGTIVPWIDEDMHPIRGNWIARDILKENGWEERKGGYERGKDYNHSLFCDLVLSGLLGIDYHDRQLTVDPLIPDDWDWFRVENLWLGGKEYAIYFDRNGTRYGRGAGLHVEEK